MHRYLAAAILLLGLSAIAAPISYGPVFPWKNPDPVEKQAFDEAEARSSRLSDADKKHAKDLAVIGFSQWKAGDYSAAEETLRQSLEIDPTNGVATYAYGDCLRRRGEIAAAKEAMLLAGHFGAPVQAQFALDAMAVYCRAPTKPTLPDPATATLESMKAARSEVQTFESDADTYQLCLRYAELSVKNSAKVDEKKVGTGEIERLEERIHVSQQDKEEVAAKFGVAALAFNANYKQK